MTQLRHIRGDLHDQIAAYATSACIGATRRLFDAAEPVTATGFRRGMCRAWSTCCSRITIRCARSFSLLPPPLAPFRSRLARKPLRMLLKKPRKLLLTTPLLPLMPLLKAPPTPLLLPVKPPKALPLLLVKPLTPPLPPLKALSTVLLLPLRKLLPSNRLRMTGSGAGIGSVPAPFSCLQSAPRGADMISASPLPTADKMTIRSPLRLPRHAPRRGSAVRARSCSVDQG